MSRQILLLLNLFATIWVTAVMWFVQIAHYPSFKFISTESFGEFIRAHMNISIVVLSIPIIVELITTLLLIKKPTIGTKPLLFKACLILLGIGLLSTVAIQTPNLSILKRGYHEVAHTTLVWSNWIRTIVWSAKGTVLMMAMIFYFNHHKKTS